MRLGFPDAAGEVTGSCTLVETASTNFVPTIEGKLGWQRGGCRVPAIS